MLGIPKADLLLFFQFRPTIDLGTICSGLEPMILIAHAVHEAVSQTFHVSFPLAHSFSCEIEEDNRAFMLQMHGASKIGYLFGDAATLINDAMSHDFITSKPAHVQPVLVCVIED